MEQLEMFSDGSRHIAPDHVPAVLGEIIPPSEGKVLAISAEELESAAASVRRRLAKMSVADIIEIGRELQAVKQRLGHGASPELGRSGMQAFADGSPS